MIKRPGHIKSLATPKDISELDRQLDMLFTNANYSTGGVPGGGGSGGAIPVWSTATRPALPAIGSSIGYNTDFSGIEIFTPSGWFVNGGIWTTAGRPSTVSPGSWGYNTTIPSREYWDGTNWNQS